MEGGTMLKAPRGYIVADARSLVTILPEKSVDVVITSPPYWNLKNYGAKQQIGFGQKYEEYLKELVDILDQSRILLKDTGSMWIIVDSFKKGGNVRLLPFEISQKLQDKGWHLQDVIIWQKDKTLPWASRGKLRNIFEYILFFTKSAKFHYYIDEVRELELKEWWVKYPERYNPRGKVPSRVWDIPIPIQGGWGKSWVRHFCPFPPLLVEKILLLTTKENDVVLDPFAGSGSVLAQAKVMKREAIGLDLNNSYKEMYEKTVMPFYEKNWQDRKRTLNAQTTHKQNFERTVRSLRQLKFPALLFKILKKNSVEDASKILCIIHEGSVHTLSPEYSIILDETAKNNNTLAEAVDKLVSKAPLSKFSITPTITYMTLASSKNRFGDQQYYCYQNGITNIFKEKVRYHQFIVNKQENAIPPILSRIKLEQRNSSIKMNENDS